MMRRVVVKSIVMLIAMSSTVALLAPLACGKDGRPERITQLRAPDPPEAGEAAVAQDRDAEADRADDADEDRKR